MFLKSLDTSELKEVFRAFPEVSHPLALHRHALMRGPSPFTPGERELIAAFTSVLNACGYCTDEHNAVAAAFGIDAGLLKAMVDDLDTAPVEPRMRPVFRYVKKLTLAPARMVEADVAAIHAAGWDDTAVFHAASVCGLFNLDNRLVQGLGVAAQPPEVFAGTVKRLHEHGYAATARYVAEALEKKA